MTFIERGLQRIMKMTWKKGKGFGKEEEVVDENNRKYIKITTKGET